MTITPDLSNEIARLNDFKGAVRTVSLDLSLIEQKLGVTVSAAQWTAQNDRITVGTPTLLNSTASAAITLNEIGSTLLKIALTTSGSDAPIVYVKFIVSDPENDHY